MTTALLRHDLEIRSDAAVLYLAGDLQQSDLPRLRAVCAQLPASVRILCVDLHAVDSPAPDCVRAVRAVLHQWRIRRRARAFRLSLGTSHLVACYHEPCDRSASEPSWRDREPVDGRRLMMAALP